MPATLRARSGPLSRRDCRTQPGVLTPGNDKNLTRPEGAEDICVVGLFVASARHSLERH